MRTKGKEFRERFYFGKVGKDITKKWGGTPFGIPPSVILLDPIT